MSYSSCRCALNILVNTLVNTRVNTRVDTPPTRQKGLIRVEDSGIVLFFRQFFAHRRTPYPKGLLCTALVGCLKGNILDADTERPLQRR